MRVAIDAAGRLVVPKPLRDALGISKAGELDLEVVDGRLEAVVPPLDVRLEIEDGIAVFRTDADVPPLNSDGVREVLEQTRR